MKNKNKRYLKYIKNWIDKNLSKFDAKLKKDYRKDNGYKIVFKHYPNIQIEVNLNYGKDCYSFDLNIVVRDKKEIYFANLYDAVTVIKKSNFGFYCKECLNKKYFNSKEEIWEEHFKDIILILDDKLKPENKILVTIFKGCQDAENYKIYKLYYKNR